MKEPQVFLEEQIDELIESIDMRMGDRVCPTLTRVIDLLEAVKKAPQSLENVSSEAVAIYFKEALQ